jgi:hypothetical protein
LQRCLDPKWYKGEIGLCLIISLIAGIIYQFYVDENTVKDAMYTQSITFKLVIMPIIILDLAFNTKHSRSGNLSNSIIAILTAILVAVPLSLLLFYIPEDIFGLGLPYDECLIVALILSTVNSHDSCVDNSKTMALATNMVLV